MMNNNENFMENLYVTYYHALKQLCMRYFSYNTKYMNQVDDCIQNVFCIAIEKQEQLINHPNPYAWLANVCKIQCFGIIRKEKRRSAILQEQVYNEEKAKITNTQDDVLRWVEQNDAAELLAALLAKLTPSENLIYTEYFVKDKTAARIAEEQDITENSVRGTLQRIRKKASMLELVSIIFAIVQFGFLFSRNIIM